jgi:hypothetical protein
MMPISAKKKEHFSLDIDFKPGYNESTSVGVLPSISVD